MDEFQMQLAVNCCNEIAANFELVDNVPYVPDANRRMAPGIILGHLNLSRKVILNRAWSSIHID